MGLKLSLGLGADNPAFLMILSYVSPTVSENPQLRPTYFTTHLKVPHGSGDRDPALTIDPIAALLTRHGPP